MSFTVSILTFIYLVKGRHFMNISTTVLQGKMTYLNDAADISSPIKVSPGMLS